MKRIWEKKQSFLGVIVWPLLLIFCNICLAGQWVNPRDVIKDPMIVRLPSATGQGRPLTPLEREEISKYGFTGLEVMTYLDDNKDPGQDYDVIEQIIHANSLGHMRIKQYLMKRKHYFKDYLARHTHDGIKPGDIEHKRIAIYLEPPNWRHLGVVIFRYFRSEEFLKAEDVWLWDPKLRRIRRVPEERKGDGFLGTLMTSDDFTYREPWEEDHRILGIDSIDGRACLVIESKHRLDPEYYLSKRISWVEKENFIDLHVEEFDREGRLLKIIDKEWQQVKPWNYWARKYWNFTSLKTKERTLYRSYGWIFDQGFEDSEFSQDLMPKEEVWRPEKDLPPLPESISDLSPVPSVKWDFWRSIGIKPELAR